MILTYRHGVTLVLLISMVKLRYGSFLILVQSDLLVEGGVIASEILNLEN